MKSLLYLTGIILLYLSYGMYLSGVDFKIVPEISRHRESSFYDYRGAINVRSQLSDGSKDLQGIIDAAQAVGLDYLITTDMVTQEKKIVYHGYFDRLMVVSGLEYAHLDMRLLSFGNWDKQVQSSNLAITDLLSQLSPEGRSDFLGISQPLTQEGNPTWIGDFPSGLNAIEILNPKSLAAKAWIEQPLSVIWSMLVYPFNSKYAFLRLYKDPEKEIQLWDQKMQSNKIVGMAGLDASSRAIPFPGTYIEFPSYKKNFEILSNHVLLKNEFTGDFNKDKSLLLSAYQKGNLYFSLDLLGNPKGFETYIKLKNKKILMGEEVLFQKGLSLFIALPDLPQEFFEVVILRNGTRIVTSNNPELTWDVVSPGVYRVVVRVSPFFPLPDAKKWVTWIYTNAFYVRP